MIAHYLVRKHQNTSVTELELLQIGLEIGVFEHGHRILYVI